MNTCKIILFTAFLLLGKQSFSQKRPNTTEKKKLSKEEKKRKRLKNIDFIDKNFFIRPAYSIQSNQMIINDKNNLGETIEYRPNVLGSVGGQVKIKGIVASYMHRLPPSPSSISRFGETDYMNIDINIQSRVVGLEFDYIDYTGFYLSNPQAFNPQFNSSSDTFPHRPDLRYFSVGFKATFVFTKSFSLNSAFAQTERMKKSAGSFMMTIGDRYSKISFDSSIVPISEYQFHKKFFQPNFDNIKFNSTFMAMGFGYSFVKKNFNFTPVFLLGTGVQIQKYEDDRLLAGRRRDDLHIRFPIYFSYKNAVGYNHNNFFMRLIWAVELDKTQVKPKGIGKDIYTHELFRYRKEADNTKIKMLYLSGQASIGIRF